MAMIQERVVVEVDEEGREAEVGVEASMKIHRKSFLIKLYRVEVDLRGVEVEGVNHMKKLWVTLSMTLMDSVNLLYLINYQKKGKEKSLMKIRKTLPSGLKDQRE